jgi:hypothetical protein
MTSVTDIQLNHDLKSLGITRFVAENNTLQLTLNDEKVIIFDIHPKGFLKTIENFKLAAKDEKLDRVAINKVAIILLAKGNDYLESLLNENRRDPRGDTSNTNAELKHTEEREEQKQWHLLNRSCSLIVLLIS